MRSPQCCAVGERGLDYTETVSSLPSQRQLFCQHIAMAHELHKPLILRLRRNDIPPLSKVMNEALLLLKQNTHRHQKLHVHCFIGALWDYQLWDGQFPRTAVGFTNKSTQTTEFATLARRLDLHWLVIETDSATTTRGTNARWCIRLSR